MKRFIIAILLITLSTLHAAEDLPPLFAAIKQGDLEFVHKYIEDGGNITIKAHAMGANKILYTPLEWAVQNKQISIIKEMLNNPKSRPQIDINIRNVYDQTLLAYVVERYDENAAGLEIVQLLLSNGIDANYRTKWKGYTALLTCVFNGHFSFLKLLLNHPGININSQDNEGDSIVCQIAKAFLSDKSKKPFWSEVSDPQQAAEEKNRKIISLSNMLKGIQLLLEAGADVSVRNKTGESFVDYTKKDPELETIYDQFEKAKARSNPHIKELLTAAKNGDTEGIKKLLAVVDINSQNEAGITALMRAAQNNNVETVEFLLSKKANPNIVDDQGMSALEWTLYAHEHGSKSVHRRVKKILELLIDAGAQKTEQARKTAVKFGYPEEIIALVKPYDTF